MNILDMKHIKKSFDGKIVLQDIIRLQIYEKTINKLFS